MTVALIGVLFSGYQLWRSRVASEAAERAANKSLEAIQKNVASIDLSRIVKDLRWVANMIEGDEYKLAKFAIAERIRPDLVRLSKLEKFSEGKAATQMSNLKAKITLIRDTLHKGSIVKDSGQLDVNWSKVELTLFQIADQLEDWAEEGRFVLEGGSNDT